jgi:endonuclease YncB( thermonuclease family)
MIRFARLLALSGPLLFAGVSAADAGNVSGTPRIVDGDTLTISDTKVRLEGIDAPETDQVCLDDHGEKWTCGIEARDQLSAHVGGREISCVVTGQDRYGRSLGTCSLGHEDLNEWMVRNGWALATCGIRASTSAPRRKPGRRRGGSGVVRLSRLGIGDTGIARPLFSVRFRSP